jgi:hypothetical protein
VKIKRRNFLFSAAAAVASSAMALPETGKPGNPQQMAAGAGSETVNVTVEGTVKHTMAGGLGASWHAIGPTGYFYDGGVRGSDGYMRNIRGSAWGGTPLVNHESQWQDMRRHFQWLGLDFVRAEIDMRMYAPERGRFDWQNDEMKILYRILDTCQENHADVFFTQMWQDVEWNAFPGVNRLRSAPKSVDDFATCLGTLMQHLIQEKKYTCIRWLCLTNEPADDWGWWLGPDWHPHPLMPTIHAVRAELDRRGLSALAISGPDSVYGDNFNSPQFDWNDPVIGAFDYHYYSAGEVSLDWMHPLIERARKRKLPIFLSEFGSYAGGSINDPCMDACANYGNQLVNAEKVLLGLNAGLDGFNRWSFTNRGDLDGQWQLVKTWEPVHWDYTPQVTPVPVPYYTYGILTRFIAKHSRVLSTRVDANGVLAAALLSGSNRVTVIALNKNDGERKINLALPENSGESSFYKYRVTQAEVESAGFTLSPLKEFSTVAGKRSIQDELAGKSITVYSNYMLRHSDPGIIDT